MAVSVILCFLMNSNQSEIMRKIFIVVCFFVTAALVGCIKEKDTEKEKPEIALLSPMPCDTIYFGEAFHYTVKITDNSGLGNISMDMHNNFGQHSHGMHEACNIDAPKTPVNPYVRSQDSAWIFSLPVQKKEFIFDTILTLPARKNATTQYDEGDYHFHIYVTDNEGYQVFTSLDVKILNK